MSVNNNEKNNKDSRITIRLDREVSNKLKDIAKASGMKPSEYLRYLLYLDIRDREIRER